MSAPTLANRSLAERWKRLRHSPRFPYLVFLLLAITAIGWQVYLYWWGVQIQRFLKSGAGAATRIEIFPTSWKKAVGPGYLEPLEPIKHVVLYNITQKLVLRGNQQVVAVDPVNPVTPDLLRSLKWLPFLRTLDLHGSLKADEWERLSELTQLKTLHVFSPSKSGMEHMGKMNRLGHLLLTVDKSTPTSVFLAIAELPNLNSLRLHFQAQQLPNSPEISTAFVEPMKALATSRSIKRFETQIPSDAALLALTELLPNGDAPLPKLNEFRYVESHMAYHSPITNEGLANLRHVPNLVHLELSYSHVNDDGLSTLKSIPTLRTLYVVGCQGITDRGAERLAELTGLQSLNVAYTKITADGLMKLTPLKRLRVLRVSSYLKIPPELRQQLPPTCKINNR